MCTIPQTRCYISWPLLCQLWRTGWNEKWVYQEGLTLQPTALWVDDLPRCWDIITHSFNHLFILNHLFTACSKQKIIFLFNDALSTFLVNGYIGFGNILIGKIPSGYLTGIDLRSTACQTGVYTTRLSTCHRRLVPYFLQCEHKKLYQYQYILI